MGLLVVSTSTARLNTNGEDSNDTDMRITHQAVVMVRRAAGSFQQNVAMHSTGDHVPRTQHAHVAARRMFVWEGPNTVLGS